jgi:hypothetical protein
MWLDLSSYADTANPVTHLSASVERIHRYSFKLKYSILLIFIYIRLFRSIQLRHLIVVNNMYEAVGIITRKDLTLSKLQNFFEEHVK